MDWWTKRTATPTSKAHRSTPTVLRGGSPALRLPVRSGAVRVRFPTPVCRIQQGGTGAESGGGSSSAAQHGCEEFHAATCLAALGRANRARALRGLAAVANLPSQGLELYSFYAVPASKVIRVRLDKVPCPCATAAPPPLRSDSVAPAVSATGRVRLSLPGRHHGLCESNDSGARGGARGGSSWGV